MTRRTCLSFAVLLVPAIAGQRAASADDQPPQPPPLSLEIEVSQDPVPPSHEGLLVIDVTPRGVGYRMGLVKGDTILGVNGIKVTSHKHLVKLLQAFQATVIWKGAQKYYKNTLGWAAPADPDYHGGMTTIGAIESSLDIREL